MAGKLKTGSIAVVLSALTGTSAFAADAIVVEPEPVDYVRVCDAYGSGFFFIPGTETCLRFSGYVRSSYEKLVIDVDDDSLLNGAILGPFPPFNAGEELNFTAWTNRARLNIDTRNETDWGTLRSLFRLEGGSSNVDANIDMDVAQISLGAFRGGFGGATYWSSNHGFGWVNGEGVGVAGGGIAFDVGFYGFDDSVGFDYTWGRDGWAFTAGIEDPRISHGRDNFNNVSNNGGTLSDVNFYGGINYNANWGGFALTAVHDSIAPEITLITPNTFGGTTVTDIGGWAFKGSAHLNLADYIPGGSVWAMYMEDGDYNTDYVHANNLLENADSAWGAAFQMDLSDEVQLWLNYWDVEGGSGHIFNAPGLPTFNFGAGNQVQATNIQEGGVRQFGIGINWYPAAAPGFHVKASYVHGDVDNSAHILVCSGTFAIGGPQGCSFEYNAFTVSLRRDF